MIFRGQKCKYYAQGYMHYERIPKFRDVANINKFV